MPHSPTVLSSRRPERRVRRSDAPTEALELALSAAAALNDVLAIIVADADGWLIAGSDEGPDLAGWAAAAPFLAAAGSDLSPADMPEGVAVYSLEVGDEMLHVGAVGGSLTGRGQALTACGEAVRRIMAPAAAA